MLQMKLTGFLHDITNLMTIAQTNGARAAPSFRSLSRSLSHYLIYQ